MMFYSVQVANHRTLPVQSLLWKTQDLDGAFFLAKKEGKRKHKKGSGQMASVSKWLILEEY